MITATIVRHLEGFSGDASLYKLSEPITYEGFSAKTGTSVERKTDHVIISATVALMSGPETYIFPADASGHVLDWSGLPGSFRGDLDHIRAIRGAGWKYVRRLT